MVGSFEFCSIYFAYLGGKFSHLEEKPSVSSSQTFGYYFSGQNDTPPHHYG